ncbi:hypothetical protein LZ31DRAFT_44577 [Colletotrichum somersetense]|nr:hypothetical protein LZ31DRAFT_44577 [Colletotrichum somersetense]
MVSMPRRIQQPNRQTDVHPHTESAPPLPLPLPDQNSSLNASRLDRKGAGVRRRLITASARSARLVIVPIVGFTCKHARRPWRLADVGDWRWSSADA